VEGNTRRSTTDESIERRIQIAQNPAQSSLSKLGARRGAARWSAGFVITIRHSFATTALFALAS
jgi:hypothetical protein